MAGKRERVCSDGELSMHAKEELSSGGEEQCLENTKTKYKKRVTVSERGKMRHRDQTHVAFVHGTKAGRARHGLLLW